MSRNCPKNIANTITKLAAAIPNIPAHLCNRRSPNQTKKSISPHNKVDKPTNMPNSNINFSLGVRGTSVAVFKIKSDRIKKKPTMEDSTAEINDIIAAVLIDFGLLITFPHAQIALTPTISLPHLEQNIAYLLAQTVTLP